MDQVKDDTPARHPAPAALERLPLAVPSSAPTAPKSVQAPNSHAAPVIVDDQNPQGCPGHTWRVETVSTEAALAERAHEWQALETLADDPNSAFQSAAWCLPWLRHVGSGLNVTPQVSFVYHSGRLVAVLPLMIRRRSGLNHLLPLGHPHTQLSNALTDKAVDCTAGLTLALAEQMVNPTLDCVGLNAIVKGCALHRAIDVFVATAPQTIPALRPDPAEFITLVDGSGLKKNLRKTVRKGLAKLRSKGPVTFQRIQSNDADFAATVAEIMVLKRDWLARTRTHSVGLSTPGSDRFLANLGLPNGRTSDGPDANRLGFDAQLEVLRCGARLVAAHITLKGHGLRHSYLSAYDPAFAESSPGNGLIQTSLDTPESKARLPISLLGYPTRQKLSWAHETVPLVCFERAMTPLGRLWLGGWQQRTRPLLKRTFGVLRHAMARLQALR
ncbi:MAG: GNAT family N-acetyltransferase [Pseudomonadota bacterium]